LGHHKDFRSIVEESRCSYSLSEECQGKGHEERLCVNFENITVFLTNGDLLTDKELLFIFEN